MKTLDQLIERYGRKHKVVRFTKHLIKFSEVFELELALEEGYAPHECYNRNITHQQWHEAVTTALNETKLED